MYLYEYLLDEGHKNGLDIREKNLHSNSDALCNGKKIALNKRILKTSVQKRCTLSEEIWHEKITVGNIIDIRNVNNLKQERFARGCSYNDLISINDIIRALLSHCSTIEEISDFLDITQEYFIEALDYYKSKYGICCYLNEYIVCFEPLKLRKKKKLIYKTFTLIFYN